MLYFQEFGGVLVDESLRLDRMGRSIYSRPVRACETHFVFWAILLPHWLGSIPHPIRRGATGRRFWEACIECADLTGRWGGAGSYCLNTGCYARVYCFWTLARGDVYVCAGWSVDVRRPWNLFKVWGAVRLTFAVLFLIYL
ncbi:JM132 [macacine gammaherpesvirus 11]|uniref:JM132 n=2 Tax=macacine gammaherpesvirus 11 TaxID=2560570 RepID=G9JMW0_9GAMA|nr:JM132 [Macaca fuscata rhadinovirus]AAT00109.1 JM132 [Macaca fuscata rhadinovirus]AEW87657.1 JM132 [Macaca fuscata rhadinovirus]AEW87827.1 JM132 [Macaca fuscata rhadinovirus]